MIKSPLLNTLFILSMGTCFLLGGCGKKPKTEERLTVEVVRPPQTELENFLEKQVVSCEGNEVCPNFIAKVVVVQGKNSFKFCTGFLTEDNIIATSASCLPNLLRLNGQDCSNDVFFFFPKTVYRPAEKVACNKVSLVSELSGDDPILWRDDVVFLETKEKVSYRRKAQIVREGIQSSKQYFTWMIDQQDEYSALIKRSTCEAVHKNYVNPLSTNESSPNMVFADCKLTNGGVGAPVIDNKGKVRAMMSKDMDSKLRTYLESTGLLTNGLKPMAHATNFACAPTTTDHEMLDERECLKNLNYGKLDGLRSQMLSTNLLFGNLRKEFEDSLKDISKYIEFGVKLIPMGDVQETLIYPKCFKPLSLWLSGLSGNRNAFVDEIKLPEKSFRRGMDPYGRIVGTTTESSLELNYVQFSLKNLRVSKRSSVLMWTNGNEALRTYPGITEDCSESLF